MTIPLNKSQPDFRGWFGYCAHVLNIFEGSDNSSVQSCYKQYATPDIYNAYVTTDNLNEHFIYEDPLHICKEALTDPHSASINRSMAGIKASAIALRFAYLNGITEGEMDLQWAFVPNLERPHQVHSVAILSTPEGLSITTSPVSLCRRSSSEQYVRTHAIIGSTPGSWLDLHRWSSLGEQSFSDENSIKMKFINNELYYAIELPNHHRLLANGIGCHADQLGHYYPPRGSAVDDMKEYFDSVDPSQFRNRRSDH